jgi:mono/diheme cytochrome c family protein
MVFDTARKSAPFRYWRFPVPPYRYCISRLTACFRRTVSYAAGLLLSVIAIGLSVMPAGTGLAQDRKSIIEGRREYLQYCAVCHGKDGDGKGPMARHLGIHPADLTQIRKNNGGEFPFWRMYQIIDGREDVQEKGSRVMPVWGAEFQKEAGSEDPEVESLIKERILRLVYYVQSIQK